MQRVKPALETPPERHCRWCGIYIETFQGLCTACNEEVQRRWQEYQAAMDTLIHCEQGLFDISFAAGYGRSKFHTAVFGQERLAFRNILDSHMKRTADYMNDLRARRITSINNSLRSHGDAFNSSIQSHPESNPNPTTAASQQVDPPELVDNDDPRKELRAQILLCWPPDKDPRAMMFLNEPLHTKTFLKLLLKIAPFYSWEDTTRMVNSMIIERIRHGENKQRCHIREDFWKVFEICRDLEFVSTSPEPTTSEELTNVNCRVYKWGLLKDGYDHGPNAYSHGVCTKKHEICVGEQAPSSFVFTYQYRNRCRNLIAVESIDPRDAFTEEEYEGSTTLLCERANFQSKHDSGSEEIQAPRKYRPYY